jgi:hypothetical protein
VVWGCIRFRRDCGKWRIVFLFSEFLDRSAILNMMKWLVIIDYREREFDIYGTEQRVHFKTARNGRKEDRYSQFAPHQH